MKNVYAKYKSLVAVVVILNVIGSNPNLKLIVLPHTVSVILQIQFISPLHKSLSQRHGAIVISHTASNLKNFYQINVTPFLAEMKLE